VLLALTKKGMMREDAYRIVQEYAMRVWKEHVALKSLFENDAKVKSLLSDEELDACFDVQQCLKNVDPIFERLGL